MSASRPPITTEAVPSCLFCGRSGLIAHEGLRDRLFGAAGMWTFLRCDDDRVWWLSPRPTKEDLPLAYREYHTHKTETTTSGSRLGFAVARDAMLTEQFGYPTRAFGLLGRGLAKVLVRIPALADVSGAAVMWLPACSGGRLLDVGCGAGLFAGRMMEFGWEANGIEPDPVAARRARESHGFPVFATTAEVAATAGAGYDAVTAAHVIEHVSDPVEFLATCWSLVKPGGTLVILTPNVESRAHRVFGPNWRGLEPPRHLVLFSRRALALAAERAGLSGATVRSSARAASFMWLMSDALRRHQGSDEPFAPSFSPVDRLRALGLLIVEATISGTAGEELVLVARKSEDTRVDERSTASDGTLVPMRIAFFARVRSLRDLQRAEFYAQDIAILRSLGHDVYIVTRPRQLRRSTDVIFCWWWTYAWQAALAGRVLGIPVVATGVFDVPTYAQRPLYQRLLMSLGAHLSSANVFVSRFELEVARRILGLRHASYSPLAVDAAIYIPAPPAKPKRGAEFVIANVTWKRQTNIRRKMLRELIEAMPRILEHVPHARLILAGPPEDGEATLRALTAQLRLSASVTFLGELSREEKIDLYRVCDVYVQCSRYEGFGLAIAEAMACGAPVIVTRVPPVEEVVGDAGVYVTDATPRGIAEAVIGLASDPQLRRELAVRGIARIRTQYSIGRRAADLSQIIRDVQRPRSK